MSKRSIDAFTRHILQRGAPEPVQPINDLRAQAAKKLERAQRLIAEAIRLNAQADAQEKNQ